VFNTGSRRGGKKIPSMNFRKKERQVEANFLELDPMKLKTWVGSAPTIPNTSNDNPLRFYPIKNLMRTNDNFSYFRTMWLTLAHAGCWTDFFAFFPNSSSDAPCDIITSRLDQVT
jgi:hypothetical protein